MMTVDGLDDAVSVDDHYHMLVWWKTMSLVTAFTIHTLSTAADSTTNPHTRIQMQVPWVSSLHMNVEAK